MVTAEIAVALPVLVLLMAAALTAVMVVSAQLRCVDAAREAARALARGESVTLARSLADQAGPAGSRLTVSRSGDEVTVDVAGKARGLGGVLPAFAVHARSVAVQEPGTQPAAHPGG
jgi:Flp pilus assembly protein TadG